MNKKSLFNWCFVGLCTLGVLSTLGLTAGATNWKEYGKSTGGITFYLDLDSIEAKQVSENYSFMLPGKSESGVEYWVKRNSIKLSEYQDSLNRKPLINERGYMLIKERAFCQSSKLQSLDLHLYDIKGLLLYSNINNHVSAFEPPPNSVGQSALKIVCAIAYRPSVERQSSSIPTFEQAQAQEQGIIQWDKWVYDARNYIMSSGGFNCVIGTLIVFSKAGQLKALTDDSTCQASVNSKYFPLPQASRFESIVMGIRSSQ